MALTNAAVADLKQVVKLGVAGNEAETPFFGDEQLELISRNRTALGYTSQIKLNEDLRDKPKQTLIRIILLLNGTPV